MGTWLVPLLVALVLVASAPRPTFAQEGEEYKLLTGLVDLVLVLFTPPSDTVRIPWLGQFENLAESTAKARMANEARHAPDLELPDHRRQPVRLSALAGGYPLIVSFYRGYW